MKKNNIFNQALIEILKGNFQQLPLQKILISLGKDRLIYIIIFKWKFSFQATIQHLGFFSILNSSIILNNMFL